MRKRQNAKKRKPAILDAFYKTIAEEGIENASVAKVAARAGIHPSLIIHYFGTKEEMLVELVDKVLDTYSRLIDQLPSSAGPEERLLRVLGTIWGQPWYRAVDLSVVYSFLAIACRDSEVFSKVQHLYRRYRFFLEEEIDFAFKAGIIEAEDKASAATALLTLSEGSHYFKHYIDEDEKKHRKIMINSALLILSAKSESFLLCEGMFEEGDF